MDFVGNVLNYKNKHYLKFTVQLLLETVIRYDSI
jgi:hypothetical protein